MSRRSGIVALARPIGTRRGGQALRVATTMRSHDIGFRFMSIIGKVESLWRYPVKSMRGEELDEAFAGYSGIYGDRLFAFKSSANQRGFPFFTGRDKRQMIRYRARFRYPEKAARPINLGEAEKLSPNINPISASAAELMIDVETPDGKMFAIDDPRLSRQSACRYR